jgi:hypothetical protein
MNPLPPSVPCLPHDLPGDAPLPDYYAEERQARDRVRVRQAAKLVGLALGLAAAVGVIGIWEGRP